MTPGLLYWFFSVFIVISDKFEKSINFLIMDLDYCKFFGVVAVVNRYTETTCYLPHYHNTKRRVMPSTKTPAC